MKKIFWYNPYQTRLNTSVAQVEVNTIVFNETIAYSFAGGQESDKATVNGSAFTCSAMVGHLIQ